MTLKQAAKSLLQYAKQHPEIELTTVVIPQVRRSIPRSTPVRDVVPLAPLAVFYPLVGGSVDFHTWP
jgi:hypothetical protein